jgi:peptide deformylase
MGKLRQIALLGAPILRSKAEEIRFDCKTARDIASDMQTTLTESNGIGLAAPQIYEPYRIIILASRPTSRYPNAPLMEPTVMINPSYRILTEQQHKDWEGCLSIPGIRALVPRYTAIEISYTDQQGKQTSQKLENFIARVFQHEYDHLEGYLFLDRIESSLDIISEKEFNKQIIG